MNEDFMIVNGDNIIDQEVFADLAKKKKEGIYLTISKKEEYYDDDMKVILNDSIDQVSKSIKNEEANAESIGLALISGNKYHEAFKNTLEELARDPQYLNRYWLESFNRMIEKGIHVNPFEVDGSKHWLEVDFHGDLSKVLQSLILKKFGKQ